MLLATSCPAGIWAAVAARETSSLVAKRFVERFLVKKRDTESMSKLRRICFLLLVAALTICTALAQQTTGIVKGTLLDDSGASVPAANVTLTGPGSTKTVKTAQTQADGTYTFNGVLPGQYTMGVVFPGFATIA